MDGPEGTWPFAQQFRAAVKEIILSGDSMHRAGVRDQVERIVTWLDENKPGWDA